jgi:hypothetical protein
MCINVLVLEWNGKFSGNRNIQGTARSQIGMISVSDCNDAQPPLSPGFPALGNRSNERRRPSTTFVGTFAPYY